MLIFLVKWERTEVQGLMIFNGFVVFSYSKITIEKQENRHSLNFKPLQFHQKMKIFQKKIKFS